MSTDKLWTAISGIERQFNNLKGELIDIDEEITQSAEAYQRGLTDAWECAKKIAQQWEEDTDTEHRLVIDDSISVTLDSMTASEAIEKLKAYEEKQKADNEIKVGDVVMIKCSDKHTLVVTKVSDESVWGVDADGSWNYWAINEVIKTDKHYDIDKILEEMKE